MTYRQILEEYKKNALPQEKKDEVAADIEKHEAISDYLYEESEIPDINEAFSEYSERDTSERKYGSNDDSAPGAQQSEDFAALINRSIRKAFIKLGITVFAAAAVLLLFIQFILPGVVSKFYYDPTEIVSEPTDSFITNRMSKDIDAYTELLIPGSHRDSVNAEALGYGKYNINIEQSVSYNERFSTVSGDITRGKLRLFDPNILKKPITNVFGWSQISCDLKNDDILNKTLTELYKETDKNTDSYGELLHGAAGSPEKSLEHINELSDDTLYYAYVTFERILDFKTAYGIISSANKSNDSTMLDPWLAVNTISFDPPNDLNDGYITTLPIIGFLADKQYPPSDESVQQQHFTDLLDYMAQQESFLNMFDKPSFVFSDASEYVKKNGLQIYGIGCVANKYEMLRLMEFDDVREIYVVGLE